MALVKCPECDNEVSTQAFSCPKCGYAGSMPKAKEEKKSGSGCGTVFGLVLILFIASIIASHWGEDNSSRSSSSSPKPLTRQEKIEKHFSAWDGSHRGLTEHIKQVMNDPDSYQHAETKYWDESDCLRVKTTYRGKNAFGGVVVNTVTAKVDLDGNVIEIVSYGP